MSSLLTTSIEAYIPLSFNVGNFENLSASGEVTGKIWLIGAYPCSRFVSAHWVLTWVCVWLFQRRRVNCTADLKVVCSRSCCETWSSTVHRVDLDDVTSASAADVESVTRSAYFHYLLVSTRVFTAHSLHRDDGSWNRGTREHGPRAPKTCQQSFRGQTARFLGTHKISYIETQRYVSFYWSRQ